MCAAELATGREFAAMGQKASNSGGISNGGCLGRVQQNTGWTACPSTYPSTHPIPKYNHLIVLQ
jgi:hypothetical protein